MYNVNFTRPDDSTVSILVKCAVPAPELTEAIKDAIGSYGSDEQFTIGSDLVRKVNDRMKWNAIDYAIASADFLTALATPVTYGVYTIKAGENGRGYALGNCSIKSAEVPTGKKGPDGKTVKELRPVFIDYSEFMKRVAELDKENKKKGRPPVKLNGELPDKWNRILTMLSNAMVNGLTNADLETIKAWGEPYTAMLPGDGEHYENWVVRVIQGFYDLLNARTGNSYKAIKPVFFEKVGMENGAPVFRNRILQELVKYRSKTKTEVIGGNVALFTIILNEYINTGVAVAKRSRQNSIAKDFKKEEPAPATAENKPEAIAEAQNPGTTEAVTTDSTEAPDNNK